MALELRGKSAIVGTGHAGFGEAPGLTAYDIMAEAGLAALADAGLRLSDVDGLFCTMMEDSMPALVAAEYLGIRPRFIEGTMTGGSSFVNYLSSVTMALEAGLCDGAHRLRLEPAYRVGQAGHGLAPAAVRGHVSPTLPDLGLCSLGGAAHA